MRKVALWIGIFVVLAWSSGAGAGTITEDFDGGTFNTNLFEFADGTGLISNGRMIPLSRSQFRTIRSDLTPTASTPLTIQADLTFLTGAFEIAYFSWRSNGLSDSFYREPGSALYYRLHNVWNDGVVDLAISPAIDPPPCGLCEFSTITSQSPGGAFWTTGQSVRISITDDGSQIIASFVNLNTGETFSDTASVAISNLVNYVSFSGNDPDFNSQVVAWDNIVITHAAIPEPSTALLLSLGLVGMSASRRRV